MDSTKNLRTKISLKNFYIFNGSYGQKEGEEEKKILFYYPDSSLINEKLRDIGFVEAIIKFTGTFSLDATSAKDVLALKTTKTMKFIIEPESDVYIVFTLNVPFERREKDKKEYIEYFADDVQESVFKKILHRSYLNFRLFCNTFEHNLKGEETHDIKVENLRSKLNNFYTKYLLSINLKNADILDAIQCLQYKPVAHVTFFRIVNFINMLTSIKNLKIRKCVFLYNQEIVYSSINPMDLFIINEYMTESLFPKYFQHRTNQGGYDIDTDRSVGKFVTEHDDESLQNAPKIFLFNDGGTARDETFRMAIYNIMDVTLLMLVADDDDALGVEFCHEIKYSIGPQINLLSKEISDNFLHFQQTIAKNQSNDTLIQEKYIYFNHRNYRFHACFYENNENAISNRDGKRNTQLSPSMMNLLCDLYAQEEEDDSSSLVNGERETVMKSYNDMWIFRKNYNQRSIYLILHKNSTLIDIADEAQRLLSEIVKNVYFTNIH